MSAPPGFSHPTVRRVAWAVVYASAGLIVLGMLFLGTTASHTLAAVRATQLDNRTTLESAKQAAQDAKTTADRIRDCTEPTGRCFAESQKRTAAAVGSINRVIVLAAACSTGLNPAWSVERRQTAIQACVIERLSSKP